MPPSTPSEFVSPLRRDDALRLAHRFGHSHPTTLAVEYGPIFTSVTTDAAALVLQFSLTDETGVLAGRRLSSLFWHRATWRVAVAVWLRATGRLARHLAAAVAGRPRFCGDGAVLDRGVCALALFTLPLQLVCFKFLAMTRPHATHCFSLIEDTAGVHAARVWAIVSILLLLPFALCVYPLSLANSVVFGDDPERRTAVFAFSAHEALEILTGGG